MARIPTLLVVCLMGLGAACHCALAPAPADAAPAPPRATMSAGQSGAPESAVPLAVSSARSTSQSSKPYVQVERLGQSAGFVTVTFTAANLFSSRIVESLSRGLPATLEYQIQLWKKRGAWFDKLVATNRLSLPVGARWYAMTARSSGVAPICT